MQNKLLFFLIFLTMFGIHHGCSSQERNSSMPKENRKPAAAGRFYPADPVELKEMLRDLFNQAAPRTLNHLQAIISPHAGYPYSGLVAANAFKQIDPHRTYDNVFVLASSHQISFMGASIYNKGDYVTPLGIVPVNIALANELIRENPVFVFNPEADRNEHSLEVQVPFLQYHLKKKFNLVPIVLGTQSPQTCQKIAHALKPYFNERNLFVISSDFSHYPGYEEAITADRATCDAILTKSPESFINFLDTYKKKRVDNLATSCCGWTSVLTLLYLTANQPAYTYTPLFYQNSGDSKFGEKNQVVGYWAIGVTKDPAQETLSTEFSFSEQDQIILLRIARETIDQYIRNRKKPVIDTSGFSDHLKMHAGAFVTLKTDHRLRGCIGRFTSDIPLYQVIQEMAIASSTQDHRFAPVESEEIAGIDIEISVLSPMKKISDIDEITMGKHGIYIRKGGSSGTFLPQVATETGWSKEDYLGHCSRDKAGIGWDGWKMAELFTYEAFVFSESELNVHKD